MSPFDINVLLFDICGVLFDVSGGVECMLAWLDRSINEEQLLKRWVSSSPVRQFELGNIGIDEFAREVIREFNFPVNESQFITEYISWHKGPYDGAIELVKRISKEYTTASFSNINELQWAKISKSGLLHHMSHNFASYKIGFVKPEKEAFAYVVDQLKCEPSRILFFDDNRVNVDAANEMSLRGHRTRGIVELKKKLKDLLGWK
jgi:putative hydrolase of the HAD superfamily